MDKLESLKTEDALEAKITGRPVFWLTLYTLIIPIAILIGVRMAL